MGRSHLLKRVSGRTRQRYNQPMTHRAADLLRQALTLSDEERATLAASLIDSLDTTIDPDAESGWEREIERRLKELDSRATKTIGWNEVRSKIISKLPDGK
jgi:putative addiction module component (TIGR02574 family)